MQRWIIRSLFCTAWLACVCSALASTEAGPQVAWVKPQGTDVDSIFAQAQAAHKPVFLYWGAVWCPPCNQVKSTVFNRPDFIARSQGFVPVYVDGDAPGAQKLGARFNVRGYPTMILFQPDGSELTRLPGEVDAAQYLQVLNWGLTQSGSARQTLAAALGPEGAKLAPESWRLLAYYSWDQDAAQLVPAADLPATLLRLAQACPAQLPELAARFRLKAVLAATEQHQDVPEAATALATLQTVLSKAALTRQHFDVLVNYAADLVQALSASGTPARKQLAQATDTALQSLAANTSLSQGDRLAAMQARVALLKLDLAPGATAHFSPAVLAQVRAAAKLADQHAKTPYERQALIPNAAELLSDAGLLAESDQMLLAELPKAEAPYYHMLVLASNAQERGDTAKALDWAEKAWTTSQGAATRLQWGSGYVARLLELSPQDTARISQAASQVLAEVPATPDTFYERNRRSLEKMAQRLNKWATSEARAKLVQQLSTQWNATCGQLPEADPARAACAAVFPSAASKTGA